LEPRVVGNNIGIHPVFTLIAMYTGFKFSGIIGLFIGPIVLIILQNVFETMIDNGIVKTILDRK
jgi:sporulation integral membrane protein ytvI